MNPLRPFRQAALLLVIALCGAVAAQAAPPAPPAPAASQQLFLPLVAKGGAPPDPTPSPTPQPPPTDGPTSDELIAAAVKSGALDQETGLLYRVFAAFGDGRLPSAYRGAHPAAISHAFDDAARVFARLKPETQAALRGFAVPPSVGDSWEEGQGAATRASAHAANPNRWETTCQTSLNIKVWYHPSYEGDAQKAREICELVDGTIWPKLVGLMGREPLYDDKMPNTGGDQRLDIYLVDAMSNVVYPPDKCEQTPVYMLVNHNFHPRAHLAELLMRAILRGYDVGDCKSYDWLFWATTNWAMDYVFPVDNDEHVRAIAFLDSTAEPLDRSTADSLDFLGLLGFYEGAYLWPFFLARHVSDPHIVRTLWDRSGEPDSLAMTNDVVPDGFKAEWPNFAALNWNREPVDLYKDDGLRVGATPTLSTEVRLDGAPAVHFDMPGKVPYLAAEYYHFTFPDDSARSVLFTNSLSQLYGEGTEFAEVQLIYRTADDARGLVTLGKEQYAPFCRDLAAEHITELTVIVSNSDWQGKKTLAPLKPLGLEVTNMPCRGWSFEASATITTTAQNYLETTTTTTKGTFELLRDEAGKSRFGYHFEMYQPVGTANWTYSYSYGECSVAAKEGAYPLADLRPDPTPGSDLHIETYNLPYDSVGASGVRRYYGLVVAPVHARPRAADSCGNSHQVNPMWLRTSGGPFDKSVSGDGQTIKDTFTERRESGGFTFVSTWAWEMKPLPPE